MTAELQFQRETSLSRLSRRCQGHGTACFLTCSGGAASLPEPGRSTRSGARIRMTCTERLQEVEVPVRILIMMALLLESKLLLPLLRVLTMTVIMVEA